MTILPAANASPYPYSIVGMALDYRLRYYWAITPGEETVAWSGAMNFATQMEIAEESHPQYGYATGEKDGRCSITDGLIADFFHALDNAVKHLHPVNRQLAPAEEDLLNRYCVVLALFETLYRDSRRESFILASGAASVANLLAIAQDTWIADLGQLSRGFYAQAHGLLNKEAILNPTFDGSRDVGGADADLMVDGCLIDIKTSINARIEGRWLHQLLGYTLLDYSDRYHIREVAIYMARQCLMIRWPLDSLVDALSGGNAPPLDVCRMDFRRVSTTVPTPPIRARSHN